MTKQTIGRIDKADFPEFDITDIKIKIDTGAYTSSIHSHDIAEVKKNGERWLTFKLLDPTHSKFNDQEYKINTYKKKVVKNSFGQTEHRFVFETTIEIFDQQFPIELSLSKRGEMKYPLLIGRRFLNKRFIVDTSKQNLSFKEKKKKESKTKNI